MQPEQRSEAGDTMTWQLASTTALPAHQVSRKEFFLAPDLVDAPRNVYPAYTPVEKLGVVMADTSPLQRHVLTFCGTVLRLDNGGYRMYYSSRSRNRTEWRMAIAESTDALTWEKVPLGQETRPGFDENTIVIAGAPSQPIEGRSRDVVATNGSVEQRADLNQQDWVGQPQVVRLPDGRWRMYYWRHNHIHGQRPFEYRVAESDDGLNWSKANDGRSVLHCHAPGTQAGLSAAEQRDAKARRSNDANFVYFNPWLRCYEQFSQWFVDAPPERQVQADNVPSVSRMIQRRVSDDGLQWSPPQLVLQADDRDPWDQQFYYLAIQYHEDWTIGSLGHYRVEDAQQTMDLELVFSRNGRHWLRPLRGGFIPRGPEPFDREMISAPNAWIDEGDTWLCLYTGSAMKHNETRREDLPSRRVMAARWPKDRFVGLAADRVTGGFLSPVFYPQGPVLKLDADVRGWLRAELCDAWGRKIEGYHLKDSRVVQGNRTDHALSWASGRGTGRFVNDPVRLRLEYSDGVVYGLHH